MKEAAAAAAAAGAPGDGTRHAADAADDDDGGDVITVAGSPAAPQQRQHQHHNTGRSLDAKSMGLAADAVVGVGVAARTGILCCLHQWREWAEGPRSAPGAGAGAGRGSAATAAVVDLTGGKEDGVVEVEAAAAQLARGQQQEVEVVVVEVWTKGALHCSGSRSRGRSSNSTRRGSSRWRYKQGRQPAARVWGSRRRPLRDGLPLWRRQRWRDGRRRRRRRGGCCWGRETGKRTRKSRNSSSSSSSRSDLAAVAVAVALRRMRRGPLPDRRRPSCAAPCAQSPW